MFTFSARAFIRLNQYKATIFSDLTRFVSIISPNYISTMTNWNCIYVTAPDKSIYLRRRTGIQSQSETESRNMESASKLLTAYKTMYLFFPKLSNSFFDQNAYVQSAIESHKIYRQNGAWVSSLFAHTVLFDSSGLVSGNNYRRGVFCTVPDEYKQETINKISDILNENTNLSAYKLVPNAQTGHFTMITTDSSVDPSTDAPVVTRDAEFCLELVDRSDIAEVQNLEELTSPIFLRSQLRPVFHDYKTARHILEELSDVAEVRELLEITDRNAVIQSLPSVEQTLIHPFVVVEGMDATGKTTLTEELEKRMGAVRYFTPPPQLTDLRPFFDKYPEIVRRAYYSMGNYIVAGEIIKECKTRPVIMDRFWHSTAAYGIANETSMEDMPGPDHGVYKWPCDLLQPTIVLFLTVSEDVRKQRLSGRGINPTFEEKSLDKDQLFRQRLCESYRRMKEPSCVEINAGGTVEEVLNMALDVLSSHGVKLDK